MFAHEVRGAELSMLLNPFHGAGQGKLGKVGQSLTVPGHASQDSSLQAKEKRAKT
jgi:hypothetical protein